jgi:hypothetical protein
MTSKCELVHKCDDSLSYGTGRVPLAQRAGSRRRDETSGYSNPILRSRNTRMKKHAADLEQEMLNRGMFFEVIDWSEDQATSPIDERRAAAHRSVRAL